MVDTPVESIVDESKTVEKRLQPGNAVKLCRIRRKTNILKYTEKTSGKIAD